MQATPPLPNRIRLAGLALACALLSGMQAPPPERSSEPQDAHAAAFDATLARATGPQSLDTDRNAFDAELDRLRTQLPPGDKAREIRLRAVYCGSSHWKDATEGLAYSEQALAMAQEAGDVASQARALLCRATYARRLQGAQHGLPDLDKAIDLLAGSGEGQLYAEALETRGDLFSLLGEQAKAMLDFQRARAAYRESGITAEVESLLLSTAIAYRRMGDHAQAQPYLDQARARAKERGDWERTGSVLIQAGFLHLEAGEPQQALDSFRQAEAIGLEHDAPYTVNPARLAIAEAQIDLGQPDAAQATLKQALAGYGAAKDHSASDMLALLAGKALARKGEHARALDHYDMAEPLIEQNGNQRYLAMLHQARAASEEALGHAGKALAEYKRYAQLQEDLQRKMRLEQGRLLQYEYEIRKRDFENQRLRAESDARESQVRALERARRWQWLALALGGLLLALLGGLAWRQRNKSRRLRKLAMTDPLTGTASRLGIESVAAHALDEAARNGAPLSVLLLDLDHFKDINDRHGHAVGDRVLRDVANAWHGQLRGRDPLGRIGGEEFVVVCRDATSAQAAVIADRLRAATAALRFPDIDPALHVTVSIGVAQARDTGETRDALFGRADAALYRAKQGGRDRVET